tara:strand:- start:2440 stop:3189 length:750 start_codon:yes stop_codon:yes gene_type:complete
MNSLLLFKQTDFSNTIWWMLKVNVQGFRSESGSDLVTEIFANRIFKIVHPFDLRKNKITKSRILVQFFEDGYVCWVDLDRLVCEEFNLKDRKFTVFNESMIQKKIPLIIKWIQNQSQKTNRYLWGGTLGPNFDCSGLLQTAFWKFGIFLPRDSYQLKVFCKKIIEFPNKQDLLKKGDILFFGEGKICNHVGIYIQDGFYYHSSGKNNGRDGIGLDNFINPTDTISSYYKSNLISAGRVIRSYQWDKTIR